MSKRPFGVSAEEAAASKRQKSTAYLQPEKLALLKEYYKELRAFIKAAEQGDSGEFAAPLERLVSLNKTALPILGELGGKEPLIRGDDDISNAATPALSSTFAQAPERSIQPPNSLIPSLVNLTAWTVEDIPLEYPPLPPIPDEKLERMALTHRGWNEVANYETLEFLGDAFIYHAASEIITQTFPQLTPGRKSQLREGLLRNSNLSQYTTHYGIEKRANFPPEFTDNAPQRGTKVATKEREKVNGDLFEAYVGALIRARPPVETAPQYDGVAITLKWLRSLWAMTLSKEIERKYNSRRDQPQIQASAHSSETPESTPQPSLQSMIANAVAKPGTSIVDRTTTNIGTTGVEGTTSGENNASKAEPVQNGPQKNTSLTSKVQLAALIGCKEVKIRYEDAPTKKVMRDKHSKMPLFTVAVWVDAWGKSECLGYGSALSKKEAGGKAAERALENKAKMKFYVAKKAAIYGDKSQADKAQSQPEAPAQEDTTGE